MMSILEKFLASPATKRLEKQAEAEEFAARQALVAAVAAAKAARVTELAPLLAAEQQEAEALKAAQQQLDEVRRRALHTETARWGTANSCDARIALLEQQLRASAPPAIQLFLHELLEDESATRRGHWVSVGPRQLLTGLRRISSNYAAITARLEAIRRARASTEQLMLEAVADIDAALETLRASLPAIDDSPEEAV